MKSIKNELARISQLPDSEQKKAFMNLAGILFGMFSKFILEENGFVCDYKINGEDISKIEKLSEFDIREKISLAVRDERYEDAAKLQRILNKL